MDAELWWRLNMIKIGPFWYERPPYGTCVAPTAWLPMSPPCEEDWQWSKLAAWSREALKGS